MDITIGKLDRETCMVPVTFKAEGWQFTRDVRAVLTDRGALDLKATRARCEQVAAGVVRKAELGLLATIPGAEQA